MVRLSRVDSFQGWFANVPVLSSLRVSSVPDEVRRDSCENYREHQQRAARLIRQSASRKQSPVVAKVVAKGIGEILHQRVSNQKDHRNYEKDRCYRIPPRSICAGKVGTLAS